MDVQEGDFDTRHSTRRSSCGKHSAADLKASPLPPAPYVMAWGLPYVVQGLSFAAQGLHMAAQGLHLAAQGLHMGAQGLHMAA